MTKPTTLFVACFLIFFSLFSCKKLARDQEFDSVLFNSELSQLINSTSQGGQTALPAIWIKAIEEGTYDPIISNQNKLKYLGKLDSLLKQAPEHGLGYVFQSYLDTINKYGIFTDSIFQDRINQGKYKDLAHVEYASRLAAIDYLKVMQFGLLMPDSVFQGSKYHVRTNYADDNWYTHQVGTNPLINISNYIVQNPKYEALQQTYARLKAFDQVNEWQPLPAMNSANLELGNEYEGANLIRQNLNLPIVENDQEKNLIDQQIVDKVKLFQEAYGLPADGVINTSTFNLLNKSPKELLRKLEVSLERFRWSTRAMYEDLLLINIPEYRMYVYNQGKPIQNHKVCVGKSGSQFQTPEFLDTLTTIVVNPLWDVPRSIIINEILPYAQMDGSYFEYLQYDVYLGDKKIDPYKTDFKKYNAKNWPFRVVQKTGDFNALGFIKFLFPNRYNIYLHDTPSMGYFNNDMRAVSHGCVRLDEPFELANYLMEDKSQIANAKASNATRSFSPKRKPQVYLTYYTTWVDDEGKLQIRDDVYGRDAQVRKALDKKLTVH